MKKNNIVIVDRNESLPVLKDAKFVYPQLQDKIVDDFLNVQHLVSYFVKRKGHQKISTLLYEIDEQGLVQYALGLQFMFYYPNTWEVAKHCDFPILSGLFEWFK